MMKIAYYLSHDLSLPDGVTKKVRDQVTEWRRQGHEVKVFCRSFSSKEPLLEAKVYLPERRAFFDRLTVNKRILVDIKNFAPDLIYHRFEMWNRTQAALMKLFPTIIEINSDDVAEYFYLLKTHFCLRVLFYFGIVAATRNALLQKSAAIVFNTSESLQKKYAEKLSVPKTYVSNGIDLAVYPSIKKTKKNEGKIDLFFILGNPMHNWNGVDLLEIIAEKLPDYKFHVVGMESSDKKNIKYYGFLERKDYFPILEKCDICIGTLALFRKNQTENPPLKTREYVASGFPVIIGYDETAFVDSPAPKWLLKIDPHAVLRNQESVFLQIRQFCEEFKDFIVPENEKYPFEITTTEKKRLGFFEQVLKQSVAKN